MFRLRVRSSFGPLVLALCSIAPAAAQVRVEVLLQVGDVPPGSGGLPVAFVHAPQRDGAGRIGMAGRLQLPAGQDAFVWFDGSVVWRGSDTPFGFDSAAHLGLQAPLQSKNERAFTAVASGPGTLALTTDLGVVLAAGAPAPGYEAGHIVTTFGEVERTDTGSSWFVAEVRRPGGPVNQVLYRGAVDFVKPTIVLATGQVVDGLTIDDQFGLLGFDVTPDGLHHAHCLNVHGLAPSHRSALYVDGLVPLRWNDPVVGAPGRRYVRFDDVVINETGSYLVRAVTDGPNSSNDVLVHDGAVLVTEGDVVAGVPLTPFGGCRSMAIDPQGRVAFTWLTSSFNPEYLFFAPSADQLSSAQVLLASPGAVDVDGDGQADATVRRFTGGELWFGEDGHLYTKVDLDYGAGVVGAVIRVRLP